MPHGSNSNRALFISQSSAGLVGSVITVLPDTRGLVLHFESDSDGGQKLVVPAEQIQIVGQQLAELSGTAKTISIRFKNLGRAWLRISAPKGEVRRCTLFVWQFLPALGIFRHDSGKLVRLGEFLRQHNAKEGV